MSSNESDLDPKPTPMSEAAVPAVKTGSNGDAATAMKAGGPTRILYSADWCWYCQRVMEKLEELGVDYEYVEVPVFHSKRSKVLEVSGQTSVPVFVDGDVVLDDDDVIIPYLEEHYAKK